MIDTYHVTNTSSLGNIVGGIVEEIELTKQREVGEKDPPLDEYSSPLSPNHPLSFSAVQPAVNCALS